MQHLQKTGGGGILPILERVRSRQTGLASVTTGIQFAGDDDGIVWGWRAERVREEGEGGGADAAGAVADAEVAGASLRDCAAFCCGQVGFQDFRAGGGTGAADVGRISCASADGSDVGFSLRDALEPARQSLERRAFYGRDEAGEEEAGGAVCAGAGGRRLHGKRAAGGFTAAGCVIRV